MEGGRSPRLPDHLLLRGDITLAQNGNTNDIRLYQQPANNSSAGTANSPTVSGADAFQPSISPDGTKLCYTFSTAAQNSTSASCRRRVPDPPSSLTVIEKQRQRRLQLHLVACGAKIAYTEDYAGNGEIYMKECNGTVPFDLTNTAGTFDGNADWSSDGRPPPRTSRRRRTLNTSVTMTVSAH